jgi:hypothetical protein
MYNLGMGVIVKDPEIMGGAPVFRGTRVLIQTLFDYLEGGDSIDDFLEGFLPFPAMLHSQHWKKQKTFCYRAPELKCAS